MVSQLSFLLISALALGVNAGVTDKLVGAKNADIAEFPYQVSLRLRGKHFCGGALITKKHVLTAAHCVAAVKSTGLSRLSAVVGTNSVSSGGSTYRIKALSSHPNYVSKPTPDWMYDIGVITLTSEVKLSSRVALVKLPTKDVTIGDEAVVSGWGTMLRPTSPLSQSLQKLTVKVISTEQCRKDMPSWATVHSTYVCTFVKKGAGACSGDSGGPLVANDKIIGVVSGGIPCAVGYPDVFTNVYKYLSYVNKIIDQ
ncbi:hypothetical protein TSAR_010708 [Trichomalopsis sarcophagae]|uniref:Peptidase S1 domain-containing protein n=1 Tax=Trichomalopsis sarcophagae TaxID=543379 RepID=A0A232ESE2_9HYME|nr:hypothetical protein TSAR_010708 [Trichomalopsis sarcophagae]